MKKLWVLIFVLLFSATAHAQTKDELRTDYMEVTFQDLSKTYWWLSLHDISNKAAVDGYAKIHDCDVYQAYYQNDFQWERIRQGIAEEIKRNRVIYPHRYYIQIPLYLNRYDFEKQSFDFQKNSLMTNVNFINILDKDTFKGYCGQNRSSKEYPDVVNVTFNKAFNLPTLELSPQKANSLVESMNKSNNPDRVVFMKLNFRVSGFEGIDEGVLSNTATIKGVVESYEIFEDPEMTKPIKAEKVRF